MLNIGGSDGTLIALFDVRRRGKEGVHRHLQGLTTTVTCTGRRRHWHDASCCPVCRPGVPLPHAPRRGQGGGQRERHTHRGSEHGGRRGGPGSGPGGGDKGAVCPRTSPGSWWAPRPLQQAPRALLFAPVAYGGHYGSPFPPNSIWASSWAVSPCTTQRYVRAVGAVVPVSLSSALRVAPCQCGEPARVCTCPGWPPAAIPQPSRHMRRYSSIMLPGHPCAG